MSRKIRIGLIYGGKSGEHDVSLQTALAVMKAVDFTKYEITPFYISKKGEWRSGAPLLGPAESKEVLTFSTGDAGAPASNALAPIFGAFKQRAMWLFLLYLQLELRTRLRCRVPAFTWNIR